MQQALVLFIQCILCINVNYEKIWNLCTKVNMALFFRILGRRKYATKQPRAIHHQIQDSDSRFKWLGLRLEVYFTWRAGKDSAGICG